MVMLTILTAVALSCHLMPTDTHLDVSINESRGVVSYVVRETGSVITSPAIFTTDFVAFGDRLLKKGIHRRTLEIIDGYETSDGEFHVSRRGMCQITDVSGRKF